MFVVQQEFIKKKIKKYAYISFSLHLPLFVKILISNFSQRSEQEHQFVPGKLHKKMAQSHHWLLWNRCIQPCRLINIFSFPFFQWAWDFNSSISIAGVCFASFSDHLLNVHVSLQVIWAFILFMMMRVMTTKLLYKYFIWLFSPKGRAHYLYSNTSSRQVPSHKSQGRSLQKDVQLFFFFFKSHFYKIPLFQVVWTVGIINHQNLETFISKQCLKGKNNMFNVSFHCCEHFWSKRSISTSPL